MQTTMFRLIMLIIEQTGTQNLMSFEGMRMSFLGYLQENDDSEFIICL